jgi:hypothetical protein
MGPIPDPKPGLVFRYDYLHPHEFEKGVEHGEESRPAFLSLSKRERNVLTDFIKIRRSITKRNEKSARSMR